MLMPSSVSAINVSLLPGAGKLADLIADTDDGIYMEINRSWSIDDRRYNFQFGTEIGWEIRGGKKTRMQEPELRRDDHRILEFLRFDLRPRALDAVGRAHLRQRAAHAGHGDRPRRIPGALSQSAGRSRLCGELTH